MGKKGQVPSSIKRDSKRKSVPASEIDIQGSKSPIGIAPEEDNDTSYPLQLHYVGSGLQKQNSTDSESQTTPPPVLPKMDDDEDLIIDVEDESDLPLPPLERVGRSQDIFSSGVHHPSGLETQRIRFKFGEESLQFHMSKGAQPLVIPL